MIKTVPILLGYMFLGIAPGLLFQESGLGVGWAFLIGVLVYADSMQSALVGILTSGLSSITTAVMTLSIDNHHVFYGLIFIQRFKEMKRTYPCVVFSLTDETYSLLCSMARPSGFMDREWKAATFFIALSDRCYWVAGSVMGALMGELTRFNTTGINFAMTVLFVVICVDQRKVAKTYIPVITGFIRGALFLMLTHSSNFTLSTLAATAASLLFLQKAVEKKVEEINP